MEIMMPMRDVNGGLKYVVEYFYRWRKFIEMELRYRRSDERKN